MININIVGTGIATAWFLSSAWVFVTRGVGDGLTFMLVSAAVVGVGFFIAVSMYEHLVYTGRLQRR